MRQVRGTGTAPELAVRRALCKSHLRGYRLNLRALPGRPDIVFVARKKVILVHGCFWHRHRGCPKCSTPRVNSELWQKKFNATRRRDQLQCRLLRRLQFDVLVVWECETLREDALTRNLKRFLIDVMEIETIDERKVIRG